MKPFRYSSIQDWYKCQSYYKYKHIDGLSDGGEKSGDMAFGSALHLAIQDLFEGGNGLDVFNMWWGLEESKGLEYTRLKHGDLAKMGADLISIFRDEQMRFFVPKALEQKMTTKLGNHLFSGTVDFIGTYKGIPSVVDWKTSAMPYSQHKIEVNEQMYGYAFMAERELGFKAEQVVYGVAVKDPKNPRWQMKVAKLAPEVLDSKLDNVQQVCNTIASTEIYTKNPTQCATGSGYSVRVCPFYSLCHKKGQDGAGEEGQG